MKSEARSQKPGVRTRFTGRSGKLARSTVLLLTSVFCLLTPSFAATHVTGTYSLGVNPSVMATVNGTAEYGLVFVQRSKLVTYNNVQYGTQVTEGYLDANGLLNDGAGNLWLDLIPSTTASPGDSYYVVTVNIQGHVHSEIWVVPEVATIDAAAVRQAQPPSTTVSTPFYQFVQQAGADLPQRLKLNLSGSGVACADDAAQLSTDCSITGGGGGGSAPIASATTSGTVKTDSTVADPVVYLKSSTDSLLAGKANLSHTHVESDVTNLVTDLAGRVPTSRTITTTAPLAGGGSLASNLTLSMPAASGSQNGYLSSGDWTTFNGKESPLTFSSPLSRSVNTISCPTCEITGNKNAAGGYAGLTASSKLNASQGQEVWSVTDLTDYSGTSGSGSTALKTTVSAPSSGQCLTWSGSNWVNGSCSGGSSNHNLLSATHPDTVPASPVLGDVLYANSTPAWTKLAGNTTTTKKYLSQIGTGSASAAPAWAQIAAADISGLATVATSGAYGDLSGTPQLANSISQVSHKWLDSYAASTGNFAQSQPASADLSDYGSFPGAAFGSQTAKYFFAAPNGTAGNPGFRAIVASDIPILNQNTTGTAAGFTGSLSGDITGTQSATVVGKINGVSLAGLATGILKNTTTTGQPSIAIAADFPTLNQNTTGNAATATDLASYTSYSIFGSGNSAKAWITPTANGQCLMSDASNYATVTPSFQTCPSGGAFTGGSGSSYQDVVAIAAPSNPTSGSIRLYADSTSGNLTCLTSSGGNCLPSSGSGVTTTGSPASGQAAVFCGSSSITGHPGFTVNSSGDISLIGATSDTNYLLSLANTNQSNSTGPKFEVNAQHTIVSDTATGDTKLLNAVQTITGNTFASGQTHALEYLTQQENAAPATAQTIGHVIGVANRMSDGSGANLTISVSDNY